MEILYNTIDCTSPEGILIKKMADKLSLAYGREKKLREAQIEIFKGFAFLLIEDLLHMAESKDLKAVKQLEELQAKSQKKIYLIHQCIDIAHLHLAGDYSNDSKNLPRKFVGSVQAYSLQGAFVASQNFENYSFPIPYDTWGKGNVRSTSVGDVIQDEDGFHLVCNIGFERLLFT